MIQRLLYLNIDYLYRNDVLLINCSQMRFVNFVHIVWADFRKLGGVN